MASTLEKLVSLQQRRIQIVQESSATSDGVTDDEIIASGPLLSPDSIDGVAAVLGQSRTSNSDGNLKGGSIREVCLKEQLDFLYADLEYLSQRFPSLTVRTLVDLAVQAGLNVGASLPVDDSHCSPVFQENGIIPALVMRDLEKLTEQSATSLPLGAAEVDAQGRMLWMNRESRKILSTPTSISAGSYFFTEIVPGANNGLFYGRFQQGVDQQALDVEFHYALTYKVSPVLCMVHMIRSPKLGRFFIFIKQVEG